MLNLSCREREKNNSRRRHGIVKIKKHTYSATLSFGSRIYDFTRSAFFSPTNDFAVNENQPAVLRTQVFTRKRNFCSITCGFGPEKAVKGVVRRHAVGQERITPENMFPATSKVLNI
jgi:hypothetical protein